MPHHHINQFDEGVSHKLGKAFAFLAALGEGVTSGVAMGIIFPQWGILFGVIIGFAGFFSEKRVYSVEAPSAVSYFICLREVNGFSMFNQTKRGLFHAVRHILIYDKIFEGQDFRWVAKKNQPSENEIKLKQALVVIALIVAAGNGFAFFSMMFVHSQEIFLALSSLCHITIMPSSGFFCLLAILVGIGYTLLMFNILFSLITADHRTAWMNFKQYFSNKNRKKQGKLWYLKTALIVLLSILLGFVSVAITLSTAGAWQNAGLSCWKVLLASTKNFNAVFKILIPILVMPCMFIFNFKNGLKSLFAFFNLIKFIFQKKHKKTNISKRLFNAETIDYILSMIASIGLLVLHVLGQGSIAAEGSDRVFNRLSSLLGRGASPEILALGVASSSEFLTDLPYIINSEEEENHGDDHNHSLDLHIARPISRFFKKDHKKLDDNSDEGGKLCVAPS